MTRTQESGFGEGEGGSLATGTSCVLGLKPDRFS